MTETIPFDVAGDQVSTKALISVLMLSRGRPEIFKECLDSLVATCSHPEMVEVVIKLDLDDPTLPQYFEVLSNIPIHTKTVVYERLNGFYSIHVFHNDLSRIAKGVILWTFCDDMKILSGDWVSALWGTRDRYKDNIYIIQMPGTVGKEGKMIIPALTKEWINALGFLSPHPNSDRFLDLVATRLGRKISENNIVRGDIKIQHNRHRVERLVIDRNEVFVKENITTLANKYTPVLQKMLMG